MLTTPRSKDFNVTIAPNRTVFNGQQTRQVGYLCCPMPLLPAESAYERVYLHEADTLRETSLNVPINETVDQPLDRCSMTTKEKTFLAFTPEQAAQYASGRGHSYPEPLYQAVLDYHVGQRETLLDVGTGPGKVVFDLLPHFAHGIGCDASPGMIAQAKLGAEKRGFADRATFVECTGEQCDKALDDTVDVITLAMAAHWLDLPAFYASAAKALRPGGTLAMWTAVSLYCHPSTPNAVTVQAVIDDCEDRMLQPYTTPGNQMSRAAYRTLPLPFDLPGLEGEFDSASFLRKQWDADGIPSAPPNADGIPGPFLKHVETRLEDLERGLETSSSVIRWREANPDKALTEEDPVLLTTSRIRELIGGESLVVSPSSVLLMLRRAS